MLQYLTNSQCLVQMLHIHHRLFQRQSIIEDPSLSISSNLVIPTAKQYTSLIDENLSISIDSSLFSYSELNHYQYYEYFLHDL